MERNEIVKIYKKRLNKYFRSDEVKTQNGRIYSRKQIEKQMRDYCANQSENFGELSHPQQNKNSCTHRYQ